ncbi:hypothetical protein MNBD_GAMMA12-414 [hydrothermal vent metagenome]|uniref:SH3b domain-containing protein n=1 Tax=hydrothermal vent metagenome TaxID=652676 RepID=A0A3B0YSW3_9ZZZZ
MRQIAKLTILFSMLLMTLNSFAFKDDRQFAKGDDVYVHSLSGLSLRKLASTTAGRQAIMKYGAKLTIASRPDLEKTLVVENIKGYWVEVDYNGIIGYAFTGFLSRFPAPQSKSPTAYLSLLEKSGFADAKYTTSKTDRTETSGPVTDTSITLINATILDGFLIARRLFSIPDSLKLPEYQLNLKMTIEDPEKPESMLSRKMTVEIEKSGKPMSITLHTRIQGSGSDRSITVIGENTVKLMARDFTE